VNSVKKSIASTSYTPRTASLETCPLCQRAIPASQRDLHHWVPKLKGGRETSALHRICHRQIHALFSETELANHYATAAQLLAHDSFSQFIKWVKTKPDGFYERVRASRLRNGKRRRR
jgi:hypothetical protein